MSISIKDLDPAFQGAGQNEYPFPLLQNISTSLVIKFNICTLDDIIRQEEK